MDYKRARKERKLPMNSNHSGFYRRTRSARKMVVVDLGFLGDTLHLVPALWEIKRHYPEAALHAVTAPVGAEVLQMVACVDRAWAFPLGPPSPAWWEHGDILRALRRERFDLAFNFSGADRTVFLTALTGARWRLAHAGGREHFWKRWLIHDWVPRQSTEWPVFEQRRQVLAAAGLSLAEPRFDLVIPDDVRSWAAAQVPEGAVHLSINASTHLKEWPLEHWIELARLLLPADFRVTLVATGSLREREQTRLGNLAKAVDHPRLRLLPSPLTIVQLAAALSRCRLHVGCDSGVLHLAMALGIPTVSIFRQYPGLKEWLPSGPRHRHVSVPCPCAVQQQPPCANAPSAACLREISPAQVLALIRESMDEFVQLGEHSLGVAGRSPDQQGPL
jgi:ADP-heptose:LPS heptosyltransferase